MPSSSSDRETVKLGKLHKELGVRRDNLRDFLGEWPARWHLRDVDDTVLRAHLMCWVNQILDGLSVPRQQIGRAAYNTTWDLDLRGLWYMDRMTRLQEHAGINRNTAMAVVRDTISDRVVAGLAQRAGTTSRLPDQTLRTYLDCEGAYHQRPGNVDTTESVDQAVAAARFQQAVRGLLGTSLDDVVELLLPLCCHVPGTESGLVIARTATNRHVVHAFTAPALLHDYHRATGNDRITTVRRLTGRELVERVRRLPFAADIVVDPVVGADVRDMLVLRASVIAAIDLTRPRESDR